MSTELKLKVILIIWLYMQPLAYSFVFACMRGGGGEARILKYRVPEMLSPAFWWETLENSEAYKTS